MLTLLPILLRQAHVAALLLCCGTGIYLGWLMHERPAAALQRLAARTYAICVPMAAAGVLLMIPLQAGRLTDNTPDIIAPATWLAVLQHTRYGEAWRWQFLLLPCLLAAWWLGRRVVSPWPDRALALSSAALLGALGATGHAAAMDGLQGWLHRGNQALHLWAVATWVGGLPWVWWQMRALRDQYDRGIVQTLIRYSQLGHVAVVLALFSGIASLFLILGPWPWDWHGIYMNGMGVKIGAVATMVALALCNRYVLVPRLRHHPAAAHTLLRHTRYSIGIATGIVLLISAIGTFAPS